MSKANQADSPGSRDVGPPRFLERTHEVHKEISPGQLIDPLIQHPEQLALRFASGLAGHYVSYDQSNEELVAVHGGPHGPENRPASIDMRNIEILQRECDLIESVTIDDTPFVTPEVRGG